MTAINAFLDAGGAHLVTDGACVTADRVMVGLVNKTWAFAHLRCAFVVNGPVQIGQLIDAGLRIAPVESFNDFAGKLDELLRAATDRFQKMHLGAEWRCSVVMVGWLEGAASGEITICSNYATAGFKAYDVARWSAPDGRPLVYQSHGHPFIDREVRRQGMDPDSPTATPQREGLAIVEAARKFEPARNIGGFCQVTTITPQGAVLSAILERWPDRIGEPIRPAEDARPAAMPTAGSRDFTADSTLPVM